MKRCAEEKTWRYSSLVLFRDDIEGIVSLVRECSPKADFTLGEYELDNTEEIDTLAKTTNVCNIFHIYDGNLTLHLSGDNRYLLIRSVIDTTRMGIASKIHDALIKRQHRIRGLLRSLRFWGVSWLLTSILFLALGFLGSWPDYTKVCGAGIVTAAILIIGSYLSGDKCTIYLHRRHEHSTFWKRNRDDVIKNMLFLIIGLVVGYGFNKLAGSDTASKDTPQQSKSIPTTTTQSGTSKPGLSP